MTTLTEDERFQECFDFLAASFTSKFVEAYKNDFLHSDSLSLDYAIYRLLRSYDKENDYISSFIKNFEESEEINTRNYYDFVSSLYSLRIYFVSVISLLIYNQPIFSTPGNIFFVYDYADNCFITFGTLLQCNAYINESAGQLSLISLREICEKENLFKDFSFFAYQQYVVQNIL